MIAHVGYIENEPPRQSLLDRGVPRFDIGVLEIRINYIV